MRYLLRAGLALGLVVAACKDSPGPADFTDPVAISNNLLAVDSAFDSDVFRSFSVATVQLNPLSSGPALAARIAGATRPSFKWPDGKPHTLTAERVQRLQRLAPDMSVASAQGRIIHDSLYGRVYQWDAALDEYTWQDSTVSGLTGVRFILYQVDDTGAVVEPVVEIGRLDLIDQSTLNTLQLQILVTGVGGTPTYVDYTVSLTVTASSFTANADGAISNGLTAGANKTLSFDETFSATDTRVSVNATFSLNSPSITFILNESVSAASASQLVINADFRVVQPGETVQFAVRITLTVVDSTITVTVNAAVRVNGHTVATLNGDAETAQWVDAGSEPLTPEDVAALEGLANAFEHFDNALTALFEPVGWFAGTL